MSALAHLLSSLKNALTLSPHPFTLLIVGCRAERRLHHGYPFTLLWDRVGGFKGSMRRRDQFRDGFGWCGDPGPETTMDEFIRITEEGESFTDALVKMVQQRSAGSRGVGSSVTSLEFSPPNEVIVRSYISDDWQQPDLPCGGGNETVFDARGVGNAVYSPWVVAGSSYVPPTLMSEGCLETGVGPILFKSQNDTPPSNFF